jgi:hypothetical protein
MMTGRLGRTLAETTDIRFNPDRGEAFWMLQAGTFTALDPASRDSLSDWLTIAATDAGAGGIDTVLDLSPRPWKVAGARTIIGVFEKGKGSATWLIVRHRSLWTLARCDDGSVSDACTTLAEILGLIDDALRG